MVTASPFVKFVSTLSKNISEEKLYNHILLLKIITFLCNEIQTRCICEIIWPPAATKLERAIFSIKVKVKVNGLIILVSFESVSLVEKECQILSLYLPRLKSYSECYSRQTDIQDKNNMPLIIQSRGIKISIVLY